jgi:hypothetical protein
VSEWLSNKGGPQEIFQKFINIQKPQRAMSGPQEMFQKYSKSVSNYDFFSVFRAQNNGR